MPELTGLERTMLDLARETPDDAASSAIIETTRWLVAIIDRLTKSQWVPVSERLPPFEQCVITALPQAVCFGWLEEDGVWWNDNGPNRRVTHWQPLPAPPEVAE